ncbi:MAG: MmgE/PrpD family protein [Arenibacterium sp.]
MVQFLDELAAFAVAPLTNAETAMKVTRLSVLDWVAVGRAGADEPVAKILRDMTLSEAGATQATLFGSDQRVPARAAALVNGTTSHALDYDDTHFAHIGHPSVAVLPAALAIGETLQSSLPDVLEAALVGMELSIRVGIWLGRPHYQTGYHQTATAGAFGATAAAGRLLGLTLEQMRHALAISTTRASGLKVQFGTMGKPYNAGIAASNGVECAQLASRGFLSNPESMDSPFGFAATHHGTAAREEAVRGMGDEWLFEEVLHKFHACCHGLHAVLEAARDLDVAEPEIAEMTAYTHPRWMSVCNQLAPDTGLGAKFSFRTVLAMTALGQDTGALDTYSERVCAMPKLKALRERIDVREDAELSETAARLVVVRRDGIRLEAENDLMNLMPMSARETRLRGKATTLIGSEMASNLWSLLNGSGTARDLSEFVRAEKASAKPDFV